jgi:chromate reductase
MRSPHDIAILVGNLQKESPNRKLAHALEQLSSDAITLQIVEIGELPLYNPDLDDNRPESWRNFRERIARAAGFIFITPEHLQSVPSVLMNALDVGSMPKDQNIWEDKSAAIAGVSTATIGPFKGHRHLREILSFLKVRTMSGTDFYLANPDILFDEEGHITDAGVNNLMEKFLAEFEEWVEKPRS